MAKKSPDEEAQVDAHVQEIDGNLFEVNESRLSVMIQQGQTVNQILQPFDVDSLTEEKIQIIGEEVKSVLRRLAVG